MESPPANALHLRKSRKEVCFTLLTELFCRSQQGTWFMILPKDDCRPDITHCTGCEWESLLPLLAYLGLITVKVTSVVKQITIARSQWQEIVQALNRHV